MNKSKAQSFIFHTTFVQLCLTVSELATQKTRKTSTMDRENALTATLVQKREKNDGSKIKKS